MDKVSALLKSRKFWGAVVGLVYVTIGSRAGISQADMITSVAVIVAYILGVALEDTAAGNSA